MAAHLQIRLGTRASALARWQADWVAAQLRGLGVEVTLVPITTTGDRNREPIGAASPLGVFTKEIQNALSDRRIDLAVHSLKDLPTAEVEGLCLAAVPERAAVADVLVSREPASLDELPQGSVVGTGSLRRAAQLRHVRPDLVIRDIRGNVDTRLRKLAEGQYDAVVLAEAGLRRLGLTRHIRHVLPIEVLLPAVGQGALGLETRADDREVREALGPLDHPATHAAVLAERAMLAALEGGCQAPIGAWGRVEGETSSRASGALACSALSLKLSGRVLSLDGARKIETTLGLTFSSALVGRRASRPSSPTSSAAKKRCRLARADDAAKPSARPASLLPPEALEAAADDAVQLGLQVADELIARGARELIRAAREASGS